MKKKEFKSKQETQLTDDETRELRLLFNCVRPANLILEFYLGIKKLRDAALDLKTMVHSDRTVHNPWTPDFEIHECNLRTLRALERRLKQINFRGGQSFNVHIFGGGGELWIAQQMRNLLANAPYVSLCHNYVVLESAGTTFWYDKRLATKWRERYALLALHSVNDGRNSDYPCHDKNIQLAMSKRPKGSFYEIILSRKDNSNDFLLYHWLHRSSDIPAKLFAQKRNAWATSLISAVEIWNFPTDKHEFYPIEIPDVDSWLKEEMFEFRDETDLNKRFVELLDCFYLLLFSSDYNDFVNSFSLLIHTVYTQAPEFSYSDKDACVFLGLRWLKDQNRRERYVAPILISELVPLLFDLHSLFDSHREGELWFGQKEPDWKSILRDYHTKFLEYVGKDL